MALETDMMTPWFVHIGFGKTGTTWMQDIFFCELDRKDRIQFLGKTSDNYPDAFLNLHYLDDITFPRKVEAIRHMLENMADSKKSHPILISSEAFSNSFCLYQQAHRLKAVIPHAKIILVLRDPVELMLSRYKYMVLDSGCLYSFPNALNEKRRLFVPYKNPPLHLPDYYFDEIIALYRNLFQDVLVLRYEDFCADKTHFLQNICDYIGVESIDLSGSYDERVNENIAKEEVETQRIRNLIAFVEKEFDTNVSQKVKQALDGVKGDVFTIEDEVREKLRRFFHGTSIDYD